MSFADRLNKTAVRRRKVATGTSRGGHETFDWSDVSSPFPAALHRPKGREILIDKKVVVVNFVAFTEANVDVREDDRLEIDGQTFNVLLVGDPAGLGHHYEIDLETVKPGGS